MSVFARYKRSPEGFRSLVELWEATPADRRQKMIEVGRAEDAAYTERVLKYVITFEDVLALPDMELAEVLAATPPRMLGIAVSRAPEAVKERFLKNAKPQVAAEVRDCMAMNVGPREIGGAQLKVVEKTRELERRGVVNLKKIPLTV